MHSFYVIYFKYGMNLEYSKENEHQYWKESLLQLQSPVFIALVMKTFIITANENNLRRKITSVMYLYLLMNYSRINDYV